MKPRATTIADPAAVEALTHPIRRQILAELRTPNSAAAVARALGEPRQKVNYHVKELARTALIRPAGERRKGHLIEKLFESVAGSFVVSPRLAWDEAVQARALEDQISLSRLIDLGEQLQEDACALLDRASYDDEEIPSASVEAEISFADESNRSAFMTDYLEALGPLLAKHGARAGQTFRVALAVYPDPAGDAKGDGERDGERDGEGI